jgi:hypothetical protein
MFIITKGCVLVTNPYGSTFFDDERDKHLDYGDTIEGDKHYD